MLQLIEYSDIKEGDLLIDVRSPKEYEEYKINGALNIPILDNEERKIVGTLYKEDVEKAKIEGVNIGSKKLSMIFEEVLKLQKSNKRLVFYCARGGMRSGILASMLGALGLKVYKVQGGYKAYRKYIIEELPKLNENINYIVLHGNTGVGKTKILKFLHSLGCDILDLEGCANHRGSILGGVGLSRIETQKQFESNVYDSLKNINSKFVFVEAESRRIGNVFIPDYIHDKMKLGKHIFVDASLEFRINVILEEYLKESNAKEEILQCLEKLERYISKENINRYKYLIENGNYHDVVGELMEKYYDPMYTHTSNNYDYSLELEVKSIEDASTQIYNFYKNNFK
ncbi:tRNA 2-selenouridine(34) synthase MnmH [Hathewaya histolytica]|uniref:tRNA 2-selenouridine synthase SelU n=1 Tax=Hathewaya histolytica TaxID=1498 RepID=A0A4U9R967_HATHI|nr:tRNA 2-selenouridine(34) synthase MnmH [Hathewaya histolytica]VTQ87418.1 tRNA 2-selenouridine synthase SelU [Hathewaya histolytica]